MIQHLEQNAVWLIEISIETWLQRKLSLESSQPWNKGLSLYSLTVNLLCSVQLGQTQQ